MARRRRKWLILLLVGTLGLADGAKEVNLAQSPQITVDWDATLGPGPDEYGTNVWWTDQDADLWQSRYAESASSMFRVPISHAMLEPSNDNDDPNAINWAGFQFETPLATPDSEHTCTYRAWFEALRDSGATILLHPSYLAPWLSDNSPHTEDYAPYPPNDLDEYREFVLAVLRYLVETVNFPPQRIVLEAMNEPDLGCGADPVTPCFWDWPSGGPLDHMDDIADVVRVSGEAAQAVDPAIRLAGVAECCGTDVVETLLADYPAAAGYLDGLTYHYYSPTGYDLNTALNRGTALAPYGLPVYLDEYGSREYLSEGVNGGLWHSWALPVLWEAGINPLQYPFSEWPTLGEPYNSMGLFHDWREDWAIKPAYWVYANFYTHLGGTTIISSTAPVELDVMAGKKVGAGGEDQLAIWVTNKTDAAYSGVEFVVTDFPETEATLKIYNNLEGISSVEEWSVTGAPLSFVRDVPAQSSLCFVLSGPPLSTPTPTATGTPTSTPTPTNTPTSAPTSTPTSIPGAETPLPSLTPAVYLPLILKDYKDQGVAEP